MTAREINKQYDEMIAEVTGTSAQHKATIKMMEEWRKEALQDAEDA
jgi:Trp operon repressor